MSDDTLSLSDFCYLVGARFTNDEVAELLDLCSGDTALHGPEDWQLFREPLRLVVGSVGSEALRISHRSEIRSKYKMTVDVFLDGRWRDEVAEFSGTR